MKLTREHGSSSGPAIRIAIPLLVVAIFASLAGCHASGTIWAADVKSPNGLWLASARTVEYGGPGNAGLFTYVYLKPTSGSQSMVQILEFDDYYVNPLSSRMSHVCL